MARYRCLRCKVPGLKGHFKEFEADAPVCDCGNAGSGVVPLVDVHFLVADDAGQIEGHDGQRYRVACDPKRDVLATFAEHYAASDVARAVSCPSCRGTRDYAAAAHADRELRTLIATQQRLAAARKKGG